MAHVFAVVDNIDSDDKPLGVVYEMLPLILVQ